MLTAKEKETIIFDLNLKIGGDINELSNAYQLESELILRRDQLQSSVSYKMLILLKLMAYRSY